MRPLPLIMNESQGYELDEEDSQDFPPFLVDESSSSRRLQALAEASAVLVLCLLAATSSLLAGVALCSARPRQPLDLYLLSLASSDLLSSLVVVPLSLATKSGLLPSHPACAVSGYLHVALGAVRLYVLMWTAVDRYLACWPHHQRACDGSLARCQCWVLFSWVMAGCLCCPPLLGDSRTHFYHEGFLCLLDAGGMMPYSVTLGCLVIAPSVLTMLYAYAHVFTAPREECGEEQGGSGTSLHVATFLLTVEFVALWLPWGVIRMLEHMSSRPAAGPATRFWLLFAAESHILWAPLTLLVACPRCWTGFDALCSKSPPEALL